MSDRDTRETNRRTRAANAMTIAKKLRAQRITLAQLADSAQDDGDRRTVLGVNDALASISAAITALEFLSQ
jgi:hypothetical protein